MEKKVLRKENTNLKEEIQILIDKIDVQNSKIKIAEKNKSNVPDFQAEKETLDKENLDLSKEIKSQKLEISTMKDEYLDLDKQIKHYARDSETDAEIIRKLSKQIRGLKNTGRKNGNILSVHSGLREKLENLEEEKNTLEEKANSMRND